MSIIIGIDHGYYAIKTAHCSFPAGLTSYGEHEPYTRQGLLEFGGCFFVCGSGRQPIQRDKTVNDNYYLLTLAAIAKEVHQRCLPPECSVRIAAGLPLTSFGRDKPKFKDYLLRSKQPVNFRFEGVEYSITIEEVAIFPQGYAALMTETGLLQDEPSMLLMDLGGWTVDLMRIDNAIPAADTAHSLELGMIRCVDDIREQVRRETGLSLTDAQIENMLAGQPCTVSRRSTKIKQEKQISHTCQNPTLLAGIVYCAHCGAKMSGFMHKDRYKLADGTIREKVQPKYNCFQRAQKSRGGRDCDGQSLYLAETVDAIVLEVVRKVFAQIRDTPYSRVAEQRIRQESNLQKVKRAAVEKKMRSAQHALERFEGEILKCLDGTSCFTEDMIAKQIRKSQKDLDDAKAEFVELQKERINETAEIRKLRSYYDDFRGWAEEFDSAPLEIKRTILSRLIDRVEVGRKYAVTIKFNISYQQFLKCDNTIEPRQEIGA